MCTYTSPQMEFTSALVIISNKYLFARERENERESSRNERTNEEEVSIEMHSGGGSEVRWSERVLSILSSRDFSSRIDK